MEDRIFFSVIFGCYVLLTFLVMLIHFLKRLSKLLSAHEYIHKCMRLIEWRHAGRSGRQGRLHVKFGATSYSAKRRYCNNNGSAPIVWARGTLRFCLCPLPFLTMRPGNKWAFISPLFVSEYRCLLSSFDCSGLFRGHIVVDSVVSAELADVQCSKCRLNFNTTESVVGWELALW